MAYLIKQKLQIQDLVECQQVPKRVLIHEPEEFLGALYAHYLRTHNFDIKHCPNLELLRDVAEIFFPEVLIFNVEGPEDPKVKIHWLANFKQDHPKILVVTTGLDTQPDLLKKLMAAGISSHLNRQLTRPQDLAVILKNILQ